jgi:hypothetical protein
MSIQTLPIESSVTIRILVNAPDTGLPAPADFAPTIDIFDGASAVPVLAGIVSAPVGAIVGDYSAVLPFTTANTFQTGHSYTVKRYVTIGGDVFTYSDGTYLLTAVNVAQSVDNATGIAAIKAKTDNLPSDPADESLIIAATTALANSIAALAATLGAPVTTIAGDIGAVKTVSDTLSTRLTPTRAGYLDNLSAGAVALATTAAAIKAKTDNLPAAPADETLIIAATNGIVALINALTATLGAPVTTIAGDIGAAKADTGTLITRLTGARAGFLDNLSAGAAALEATAQLIKAKTDGLPAAPADETAIIAAITAVMTRLGVPANVTIATDIAGLGARLPDVLVGGFLKVVVQQIANGVITTPAFAANAIDATVLAASAATEIATAVRNLVVEVNGNRTLQQALSIILSFAAGITTGGGNTLKDPSGTDVRIAAVTNSSNERIGINLTPSP